MVEAELKSSEAASDKIVTFRPAFVESIFTNRKEGQKMSKIRCKSLHWLAAYLLGLV